MDFLLRRVDSSASSVVKIKAEAGFVVKSKLEFSKDGILKVGTKVFINVCHGKEVPKPEIAFNPSIVYPLITNNRWEIPIITSSVREDKDKKGQLCYVWDCCINSVCMGWVNKDLQLKEIVVEWCLESCELRQDVAISRESVVFPKLRSKGTIPELEMLKEELETNAEKAIQEAVERSEEGPAAFLELRRSVFNEDKLSTPEDGGDDGDMLPPLFPNTAANGRKPLIEEIDPSSVNKRCLSDFCSKVQAPSRGVLEYDVKMGKTADSSKYKLKIEVKSQLSSAKDYSLQLDTTSNVLVISNTNTDLYEKKELRIPLPNIYNSQPEIASFFTTRDNLLKIFI
ncbi:HBR315Wp [Eremothecium sinecaudum]|uniref:HBR315Wp n=1 Tax=Eremothecium sinecaudum TaxID=45286 RepID=A0A120K1C7_9SACH|nr:HBR315Wp [Eremothecium sinecaudum]AMD19216.1 HBR315Wp [Eremothecium sinecaudum]